MGEGRTRIIQVTQGGGVLILLHQGKYGLFRGEVIRNVRRHKRIYPYFVRVEIKLQQPSKEIWNLFYMQDFLLNSFQMVSFHMIWLTIRIPDILNHKTDIFDPVFQTIIHLFGIQMVPVVKRLWLVTGRAVTMATSAPSVLNQAFLIYLLNCKFKPKIKCVHFWGSKRIKK